MKGEPIVPPICLSATYKFEKSDDLIDVVKNRSGFIYSRWDNPTVLDVEKYMAKTEGFENAIAFGSGMAAITSSVFAFLDKNSRVVYQREIYGGTFELLHDVIPRLGIQAVDVNCDDTDRLLNEIEKGVDILYLETPTNPLLKIVDLQLFVEAAHKQGALVLLDSTFASPVNQHPKDFGVDIVIHSATKYIGGHHDITGGFVCCDSDHFESIWTYRKIMGGVMDAMTAFLCRRGLETLEIRVKRQNQNALQIAEYLNNENKIKAVHYPGLPDHPEHHIAKKQMHGFGGMLSFELGADFDATKRFMDNLKTIELATSLGGVSSLANQPITNTHAALSPEARAKAGISESLVRLSVGIEDPELIIQDLQQALKTI